MEIREQRWRAFSVIVQLGNPVFIISAIVLPNAALAVAMTLGSLMLLNYVHIMAGALWTGIDLFMGIAVGAGLGRDGAATAGRGVQAPDPEDNFPDADAIQRHDHLRRSSGSATGHFEP